MSYKHFNRNVPQVLLQISIWSVRSTTPSHSLSASETYTVCLILKHPTSRHLTNSPLSNYCWLHLHRPSTLKIGYTQSQVQLVSATPLNTRLSNGSSVFKRVGVGSVICTCITFLAAFYLAIKMNYAAHKFHCTYSQMNQFEDMLYLIPFRLRYLNNHFKKIHLYAAFACLY